MGEPFSFSMRTQAYELRLYVAGNSRRSREAIATMNALCEAFPAGRFVLEVLDLYEHPEMAKADSVLGAPTVVRVNPPPRQAFVGSVTDYRVVLLKLGIPV